MSTKIALRVLLLAGGMSSRMGQPKHLLNIDGLPLYVCLLRRIRESCPNALGFHMSIRNDSTALPVYEDGSNDIHDIPQFLPDQYHDIGPAAGLLTAYTFDPNCHWLVVACDFPLLTSGDIQQLIDAYEDPITCFKNSEGYTEPLLAIWSPKALQKLDENVKVGHTGPNSVVKSLNGKVIRPAQDQTLYNTNTPEQWQHALTLQQEQH